MRPDTYRLMVMAVEEGVKRGYQRAHKYVDDPTEEQMCDAVTTEVVNSMCEWFAFDDVRD